jgi:hypothetical protein
MKTPSVILHQKIDSVATNVSSILLNYLPSTIAGLGQTYLSTAGGGGSGDVTTANLTSTVTGLGQTYASTSYVDKKIADLVSTAPAILDTLGEIAVALNNDPQIANTLLSSITTETSRATGAENTLRSDLSSVIISAIPSTVTGLGTAGYVSTSALTSTTTGLGSAGYISTGSLTSNYYTYVQGPGRIGASSNLQINGTNPQLNAWTEDIAASVNSGTAITIDCLYNNYRITMTGNVAASNFTFTSNNLPTGKVFGINLWISQDATGSRTLGWPTTVKWPGATAPALTTTASKTDIFNIVTYDKGSNWFGFVAGKNY